MTTNAPYEIYLAVGLFNAAERLHNLMLERELLKIGRIVRLPQRRALHFIDHNGINLDNIVRDCQECCLDNNVICVVCIDGADADSGSSLECGIAITATGHAITYRTDFRTAPEKEVGVNGMFRLRGIQSIYMPCYYTELSEVDLFYRNLALQIHTDVLKLEGKS